MKVVILCGGMGTRLREETEFRPKPMVEIGGRPILWHIMKIYSHYGFNEFVLCLGYKGETIKEYFLNFEMLNSDFTIELGTTHKNIVVHETHKRENWKITLVDTGLQSMTGARIKRVEPFIDTDIFMLTYGDGVANVNITKLLDFHRLHGKIATVTGVKPLSRFGFLSIHNDTVTSFAEKPPVKEEYINGGFFVFNRALFAYLENDDSCIFEREPMERLAAKGELMVYRHDGYWHCMDTIRDRDMLEREWQQVRPGWKVWA